MFGVQNSIASRIFKGLFILLRYFQDLFHCSKFFFSPYYLSMTWQGVQLPIVLVEILFEWGTKNFRFFAANLDKITKVRLRTKEIWKVFCPKYRYFIRNLIVRNLW